MRVFFVKGKLCLDVDRGFYLVERANDNIVVKPIEGKLFANLGRPINVKEIEELIAYGAKS